MDTDREITLVLGPAAWVGNADDWAKTFRETLAKTEPLVTLDLGAVESVDVSFLQLVLAFQKSLTTQGRHLLVRNLPRDHVVLATARLAGLPLEYHLNLDGEAP